MKKQGVSLAFLLILFLGYRERLFAPQSIFLQKNGKKYRKKGRGKGHGRESKLQLDSSGRAGKDILFRYSDSFDD